MDALYDLLEKVPKNAQQRYKGMTLQEAIDAASKRGDADRIGDKALENYYNNIVSIFKFACTRGTLARNPLLILFSLHASKQAFKKVVFTTEEVNCLFRSKYYLSIEAVPIIGKGHARNDRFWIPLLTLFHGFRSNEVCQLYTEDVKVIDGINVILVREETDDGERSLDKRLKTEQSRRMVPVHPEPVRRFLDFVHDLRKAGFIVCFRSFRSTATNTTLMPSADGLGGSETPL